MAYYLKEDLRQFWEQPNNKIKTIQKRAYGFRDHQYFIWRIYGLHETKYALLG